MSFVQAGHANSSGEYRMGQGIDCLFFPPYGASNYCPCDNSRVSDTLDI